MYCHNNECEKHDKEKRIKELEQEIKRLKNSKEEEKPNFNEPWKPNIFIREPYYYIDAFGNIAEVEEEHDCLELKKNLIKFYNYFRTKKQALEIKVYNLLKNFSEANKTEFEGIQFSIFYNNAEDDFYVAVNNIPEYIITFFDIKFNSQEVAEEAVRRYRTE
jgi:hypothetical protein